MTHCSCSNCGASIANDGYRFCSRRCEERWLARQFKLAYFSVISVDGDAGYVRQTLNYAVWAKTDDNCSEGISSGLVVINHDGGLPGHRASAEMAFWADVSDKLPDGYWIQHLTDEISVIKKD